MRRPVLTKADFLRRYVRGEFGNAPRTWLAPSELSESGFGGLVHLRSLTPGGLGWYDLTVVEALRRWFGLGIESYYVSEMGPPDQVRPFQCEVSRGLWSVDLTYTTVSLPMRDAMEVEQRFASGAVGLELLRRHLCPASLDWLRHLLDEYPGHVVELSTFEQNWGTLPQYNTLFWEVRAY